MKECILRDLDMALVRDMCEIRAAKITKQQSSRLAAGDKANATLDKIEARQTATRFTGDNIMSAGFIIKNTEKVDV